MLEEILNTRIMVKQSMKSYKQDKALMKLLGARQLGLKLIANVTFGYTAANYSGRMPSVEVSNGCSARVRANRFVLVMFSNSSFLSKALSAYFSVKKQRQIIGAIV